MVNFPSNYTFPDDYSFPDSYTFPDTATYPLDTGYFSPPDSPAGTFHSDTLNWRDRALAGGGLVDDVDMTVLNPLVEKIHQLGLRDSINANHILIEFLPLIGGNLQAALTPLWFYPGLTSVTNFGFIENNYSRSNGLTSNVFTFIQSNIQPGFHLDFSSISIGLYNKFSASSPSNEIISDDSQDGNNRLLIHSHFVDGNIYFDVGNAFGGRTVAATNGDSQGLIVGSKVSNTKSSIFRRGIEIGSSNTEGGTLPFQQLKYFKCNSNDGSFTKTFGLVFVGKGIPLDKQAGFNSAVQDFMVSLGRAS